MVFLSYNRFIEKLNDRQVVPELRGQLGDMKIISELKQTQKTIEYRPVK